MSDNAIAEINAWHSLYKSLVEARDSAAAVAFPLVAKAISLQQAGVILMESDPDIINQRIEEIDTASLR